MEDNGHRGWKRRAMTSEDASRKKRRGHKDEEVFASLIGGKVEPGTGKRDVIQEDGLIYSVKGGEKKWQIFLYGKSRFKCDVNIPGREIFMRCIDSFPEKWEEYKRDKQRYKHALQPAMRDLKDFLSRSDNKRSFLQKAFFNDKVGYLTIKDKDVFRIFEGAEVVEAIDTSTDVVNSKARTKEQTDDLKVVFKVGGVKGTTIGEIELRTDREEKFRLVKFWMFREKTLDLLKSRIGLEERKYSRVIAHGRAINVLKVV